ncbi:MAG: hypothetical protein DVB31_13655 [Verrucomicrobia bacterium]|nr:MAG: hypothetical protein DVB31_13655 [Verrucomicrobiota bacterium]
MGAASAARLLAGDPPAKRVVLPRIHVEAVDVTNMTFTVVLHGTNLTVRVTPATRFFLHGNLTLSKNLEHVEGSLRQPAEGPPEAVCIQIAKLAPE